MVKKMINISVTNYPKKEIYAVCRDCGAEIWRETWDTYADYNRKKSFAKKLYKKCPRCGVQTEKQKKITWQRELNGDYAAQAPDGDFLIWRYGRIWKGRWRKYGAEKPVMLGFASTLELMKQRCERSEFWPKEENV